MHLFRQLFDYIYKLFENKQEKYSENKYVLLINYQFIIIQNIRNSFYALHISLYCQIFDQLITIFLTIFIRTFMSEDADLLMIFLNMLLDGTCHYKAIF